MPAAKTETKHLVNKSAKYQQSSGPYSLHNYASVYTSRITTITVLVLTTGSLTSTCYPDFQFLWYIKFSSPLSDPALP